MSRLIIILVALLVIVGGGLFLLGSASKERPVTQVEQTVELSNLAN